jgi:hypothetical protein
MLSRLNYALSFTFNSVFGFLKREYSLPSSGETSASIAEQM